MKWENVNVFLCNVYNMKLDRWGKVKEDAHVVIADIQDDLESSSWIDRRLQADTWCTSSFLVTRVRANGSAAGQRASVS